MWNWCIQCPLASYLGVQEGRGGRGERTPERLGTRLQCPLALSHSHPVPVWFVFSLRLLSVHHSNPVWCFLDPWVNVAAVYESSCHNLVTFVYVHAYVQHSIDLCMYVYVGSHVNSLSNNVIHLTYYTILGMISSLAAFEGNMYREVATH